MWKPGNWLLEKKMTEISNLEALYLNPNTQDPEKAISKIIDHAAGLMVSDLFLTSNENHVRVMARHLGLLRLLTVMPMELGRRCIAHIKAVAGMDVGERRRPLDG